MTARNDVPRRLSLKWIIINDGKGFPASERFDGRDADDADDDAVRGMIKVGVP
jgi:hypothetical protein